MLLVFVDETTDAKFRDYLGLSIATINARFYPLLKTRAQAILQGIGWDPAVEFKGSHIFSATSGCTDVVVESRIDAAHALLDLNASGSNCRMKFYFGEMGADDHRLAYLAGLPGLLFKAIPPAPGRAGKNLLSIACDTRSDITAEEIDQALSANIARRGYVLLEQTVQLRSSFSTVGIMFADLVGYLAGRIDTISRDSELFEGLSPEQFERNGKIRKLQSSKKLVAKIKRLSLYTHTSAERSAA